MRITLDTNSLIDASSDDYNYSNRIIDEILAGKIQAFANRATLAENRLIARRKVTDGSFLQKLDQFFEAVNLIETKNRLDIVEDAEDNKILESAVDSGAEFLVTSDKHLLTIDEYAGVKILPPSAFWAIYEEESGDGWQTWLKNFISS